MERRKFLRILAFSSIRLFTTGRDVIVDGDLLDISMGGVCVANIDRPKLESFSIEQELEFGLMIGTEQFTGIARVVWIDCDRLSIGLEFITLYEEENREKLASLIHSGF